MLKYFIKCATQTVYNNLTKIAIVKLIILKKITQQVLLRIFNDYIFVILGC
jgi:hypothetical protein